MQTQTRINYIHATDKRRTISVIHAWVKKSCYRLRFTSGFFLPLWMHSRLLEIVLIDLRNYIWN